MQNFEFKETEITGLIEVTSAFSEDSRGYFLKDYAAEVFAQNGYPHDLKEVFYTSSHRGVIRGMHFQREKQQGKLVRCIHGHIYDVVVDLRPDSASYLCWKGFELTEENRKALLIPSGCAHGFLAIKDSLMVYKCSERFYGEYDDGIRWNDQDLNIEWPLERVGGLEQIELSEKDKGLQSFAEFRKAYGGLK